MDKQVEFNVDDKELQKAELEIYNNSKIEIKTQTDYEKMAELCKRVKSQIDVVKATFKDMKESAYNTHKAICKKEKSFIEPLENIENEIKARMSDYLLLLEQERLQLEENASSSELSADGLTDEEALIMNSIVPTTANPNSTISGVSSLCDYDIEILNPLLVPSYLNNMEIRPINPSAIKKIVKLCNGNIKINGVKIIKKMQIKISNKK